MPVRLHRSAPAALLAALFLAAAAILPHGTDRRIAHAEAGLTRGIVVGTTIGAYAYPWSSAEAVCYYTPGAEVHIRAIEYGDDWIVGEQT
ncbi:MAG: hypothetical protein EXR43_05930 [Dehalococcoidia bacterium]|nr:hypothetical protein [Dehalococcoidia bacterium]